MTLAASSSPGALPPDASPPDASPPRALAPDALPPRGAFPPGPPPRDAFPPGPPPRDAFPPGPPPRDGLFASARYYANFLFDPIGFVGSRFDRYGDIYYAPSGGTGLYVLRHPDHLRDVLVTRASSFHKTHSAFDRLSLVLGDGLLTTDGDTWKRQRRLVQPAFAQSRLAGYATVMTDEARRAAASWRSGQVVDMSREMMQLTLRVVSRALFGHDVPQPHIDEVGRAMTLFQAAVLTPDTLPSWARTPSQRKLPGAIAALDAMMYGLIEARRAARKAGAPPRSGPPDLLQMLLDAVDEEGDGGSLNDREIRDQLVTLFLAGHETTSHALTWTLYLLSQNPRAERALHAEVDGVLQGRTPTYEDLARMPYTQQVVEESMRLYPPVYSVARKAHEDTEIGGYRVKAGSEAILWIYMTHRDARFWPDPTAFRPERFTAEEEAKRPKLAYAPFGAGPRACIGKVFAMIEARLILATLAQVHRFELARSRRVQLQPRITLVPKGGMRMRPVARAS